MFIKVDQEKGVSFAIPAASIPIYISEQTRDSKHHNHTINCICYAHLQHNAIM